MKYLQDDSGNTLTIPSNVLLFKRTVSFITWAIRGDFSTDFTLPNDSEVRKAIGYTSINQVGTTTSKAFRMMSDGNQIASGKLFIREIGTDIKLFFASGNSNWVNRITGSIRDVDMSDYNVSVTGPNINALRTATSGVLFPIIDWMFNFQKLSSVFHVAPTTLGTSIPELYPCFFEHTIFERIFDSYDLNIDGPLLDDPIYKALIFTPEEITPTTLISPRSAGGAVLKTPYPFGSQTVVNSTQLVTIIQSTVSSMTFRSADMSVTLLASAAAVVIAGHITVQLVSSPPRTFDLILYKNGVPFLTKSFTVSGSVVTAFSIANQEIGVATSGDKYQWYLRATGFSIRVVDVQFQIGLTNPTNYIEIKNVMPDIDQIDFIKHIAQRFNCLIEFNDVSQTLTFTPMDMIRLTDAVDISDKVISYKQIPDSGFVERNYVRAASATELDKFKGNNLDYGDALIQSDGEGEQDLYTTIFAPAQTYVNPRLEWLTTFVPLIELADDGETLNFTSVSNSAGQASFNSTTAQNLLVVGCFVRLSSLSGTYTGYGVVQSVSATAFTMRGVNYEGSTTGTFNLQIINYNNCGSRELIVIQNLNVNAFNAGSQIYGDQNIKLYDGSTWPYASAAWAYYAKEGINTALDNIKTGLNYGPINGAVNITFGDLYNKTLRKIVTGRRAEFQIQLTETEYNNLVLASYFYARTKDLAGYFLINDMGGYQDSNTPVTFNLVLIS